MGVVGGFFNFDVLGFVKGWVGIFKYNELAKKVLEDFFVCEDVFLVGICNGC